MYFIGYPKKFFSYLFYRPSCNVVFVARKGVFRQREFITQGTSNTSDQPEEETPVEPIDVSVPLRHSTRVRNTPDFYGFHITTEDDTFVGASTLVSFDEPNNYKEAMVGSKSAKWKEAMDIEI